MIIVSRAATVSIIFSAGILTIKDFLYGNATADPLWDFTTSPNGYLNFITISDTGGIIGTGSYQNMYLFSPQMCPFWIMYLQELTDTVTATGLDVTGDGKYLVCSIRGGLEHDIRIQYFIRCTFVEQKDCIRDLGSRYLWNQAFRKWFIVYCKYLLWIFCIQNIYGAACLSGFDSTAGRKQFEGINGDEVLLQL